MFGSSWYGLTDTYIGVALDVFLARSPRVSVILYAGVELQRSCVFIESMCIYIPTAPAVPCTLQYMPRCTQDLLAHYG